MKYTKIFQAILVFVAMSLLFLMLPAKPALAVALTTFTPASGPVGTVVTVSGSGTVGETVTITYDTVGAVTTSPSPIVVPASGLFTATFAVPASVNGLHTVTVSGNVSGAAAPAPTFTVTQAISVSPTTVRAGDLLTVSGTGFRSGQTVTITYDGAFVATTGSLTTGSFTTSFTVPGSFAGTHTVSANDGLLSQSTTVNVLQSISVSPTQGTTGTTVTVNGVGFSASRTVTISYDASTVTTAITNSVGSFTATFAVPASTAGTHTVAASDGIFSLSTTFSVVPTITITPAQGVVGTSVSVSGTAFFGSQTVTITYDGATVATTPTTITSSTVGSFTATFNVPAGLARSATVRASDGFNSSTTSFTLLASIRLNPATGAVGSQLIVSGNAFDSSTAITISLEGAQIGEATADSNGSFSATLAIPPSFGGAHTVTASDVAHSATATLTVTPSVRTNPNTGRVGTQVTVSGSGFSASRQTAITMGGTAVANVTTDANGSFSATFAAPAKPGGAQPVAANDGALSGTSSFTVIPGMTINPARGPVGAQVTVSGNGFAASGSLNVTFGPIRIKTVAADPSGSFSDTFPAPQTAVGAYNVTVTDGTNTATAAFAITHTFNINPTTGNVGTSVTVTGSGFTGTVTISYDNAAIGSAGAGAGGSFSTSFTVPPSVRGNHVVAVNDANTRIEALFVMESTPPPAPTAVAPETGSRQSSRPTLQWGSVTDPSGVSYTLQIAKDAAFTAILLEKKDLTVTQYQLSGTEKLPSTSRNAPYYWRVKAVDRASNESPWVVSNFYVGLLPEGVKYVLIGLGALVLFVVLFSLGMRMWRAREG
ncbi:MAG: hypothetical protein HY665_06280 [Chloroflexi bacterium]|nr:hypothetical protein [Chloroflexota bacterium]